MRLSDRHHLDLYTAIHNSIRDIRMELNLPPKKDYALAQVGHKIWSKQKKVLGIHNTGDTTKIKEK